MGTTIKREEVRPVRVTVVCDCVPEGSPLEYTGSTAGRPPTHMYRCGNCRAMHFLTARPVTIEYTTIEEAK